MNDDEELALNSFITEHIFHKNPALATCAQGCSPYMSHHEWGCTYDRDAKESVGYYTQNDFASGELKAKLDEVLGGDLGMGRWWSITRSPGSVECVVWWPDPYKDDSSPGYKPHTSEVRVNADTETMAVALFAKACVEAGLFTSFTSHPRM